MLLVRRNYLMGSAKREKPEFLAEKLLAIRNKLSLTLEQMADELSTDKIKLRKSDVSRYETGSREPSLIALLRYAHLADVSVDALIDDKLEVSKMKKTGKSHSKY